MACSSSESYTVVDYGSCGQSKLTKLELSRGLHPGMVLNAVAATAYRTSFNVVDAHNNILLHISPRIDENVVVFNSRHGCSNWGREERPSLMPIKKSVKYCLHIAYQSDGYRVFINGEEFHFYKHRIHNPATLFEIVEANVFSAAYTHNEPRWAIQSSTNGMYIHEYGCGKSTPHELELQGCNPLSWVLITATVNCNAGRFDINLIDSSGQIIFHFNPRFEEHRVVRNSTIRGKGWGKEERDGGMPFQKNQKFILGIVADTHCYRTYINGEEFITYNHRLPANSSTKLRIENDIQLLKVIYQK